MTTDHRRHRLEQVGAYHRKFTGEPMVVRLETYEHLKASGCDMTNFRPPLGVRRLDVPNSADDAEKGATT